MCRYEKALKAFVARVTNELNRNVQALIVYGSIARGEATEESDIDLMVVLKRNDPELAGHVERIRDSVVFGYGQAISLDFETYEGLRKLVEDGDLFARNVLEEGKVLMDPKGYFNKLRAIRLKFYQPNCNQT